MSIESGSKNTLNNIENISISTPAPFGLEFLQVSSEGESTTTGTGFIQKVRLTTLTLLGTYRIGWSIEIKNDNVAGGTFRLHMDDTTFLGSGEVNNGTSPDYIEQTGFKYETFSSGTHTFDLDFRSQFVLGNTTSVQRARIEIWKVA